MNWANLTPVQAAIAFCLAAGLATWLYLRQRKTRGLRVSSLRFWPQPLANRQSLRRIRDRGAWIVQLLFLLLVIFALADLRQQSPSESRSVAIVLDTSIWSQVLGPDGRPYLEWERQEANRVLGSLSENDRVLLVRAEAAPEAILPFTTSQSALRRAIAEVQSSSTIADLPRALNLARSALAGSAGALLVYVGPGRFAAQQKPELDRFERMLQGQGEPRLVTRIINGTEAIENVGVTGAAVQRDSEQPNDWQLLTKLTNYGQMKRDLRFQILLNGTQLGAQQVTLPAGQTVSLTHDIHSMQGGVLQMQIGPSDVLDADNRAELWLPESRPVRIGIVSADPVFAREMLNVLGKYRDVAVRAVAPGAHLSPLPDIEIYGDAPSRPTAANSIWFVRERERDFSPPLRIAEWNPQHPVTQWIRTRDVIVSRAAGLTPLASDTVLARADANGDPLIIARDEKGQKLLMIGFDPQHSNILEQEAFPLMMAGAIEWMTGAAGDRVESRSAGMLNIPGPILGIVGPAKHNESFTRTQYGARLLARQVGVYRIQSSKGESSLAVNAPPLPMQRWHPTAGDLPLYGRSYPGRDTAWWRWLVLLAIVALWLECWLFYSNSQNRQALPAGSRRETAVQAGGTLREWMNRD